MVFVLCTCFYEIRSSANAGIFIETLEERVAGKTLACAPQNGPFHLEHAPAYSFALVVAKLMNIEFQLVWHRLYFPYLVLSNCSNLFYRTEKWLVGRKFYSKVDITPEMNAAFEGFNQFYSSESIIKLKQRWRISEL